MIRIDRDHLSTSGSGLRHAKKLACRERILGAARDLFSSQGFEATTGRQICQRAGIGTGTLFLYVKDKRELLFLLFRDRATILLRDRPRSLRPTEGIVDGLMRLFGPFLDFYAEQPELAALFVQELLFRKREESPSAALSLDLGAAVTELLRAATARGEVRDDVDPSRLSAAVLAHYVFVIQGWLGVGWLPAPRVKSTLRNALTLQLEGLARRKRPRPLRSSVARASRSGAVESAGRKPGRQPRGVRR